ncbi:SAM-dependent methyltransferase [Actinomadura violacea]|uniref:SAM-dependent methyltransferase n=1 Tax=Actinomadura violacea TaxID=2819934 RepID=A0ABS3RV03_9ACTN|nr:SAM-dependent methyltransferase [Actinomadura violacea]MBO2459850.1 SAM-dependent methyltransferase [Actinomadura violacea]
MASDAEEFLAHANKDLSHGIDTSVPHSARIWNYWLGGKDNFAVDQEAGNQYAELFPGIFDLAKSERAFLGRAIQYLVSEAGVRQFLDVGTGLPTEDNTHQVAQRLAADCRIVYVDNDPLVLAHANALLVGAPEGATHYINADMRDPQRILAEAAGLLDFAQPVGLLFMGVLGHVTEHDEARAIVSGLLDALPSGSYLALNDGVNTNEAFNRAQQSYDDTGAVPYRLRSPQQIAQFFDGLQVVEPGIVPLPLWRPDLGEPGAPQAMDAVGGVGMKP